MKVSVNNINTLINAAKAAFTSYIVSSATVNKDNQQLTGISFRKEGESIAPTLYAEHLLEGSETIDDAIKSISKSLELAEQEMPAVPEINKEYVINHASFVLVNTARNKGLVESCFSWPWMNLSLVACFNIDNDEEQNMSAKVTNALAESLHITPEEFYEAASVNILRDANIKTMAQVMAEIMGIPEEVGEEMGSGPVMYVVSNNSRVNGAAVAASVQVMSALAEELADDLLIIPSSRHEVIVMPSNGGMKAVEMAKMISEVNSETVSTADYLSDTPYIFRKDTKTFGFYEDTEGEAV